MAENPAAALKAYSAPSSQCTVVVMLRLSQPYCIPDVGQVVVAGLDVALLH